MHRFFRWFCHPRLLNHIEGDLMELYTERLLTEGRRKANRKFIVDVIRLFRPGIIKPVEGYKSLNTYGMYKSYFKVGWRNLLRNKGYSFINIGGLAIGMMVAILNGLWIAHEFSWNKPFDNYERIAQVTETGFNEAYGGNFTGTTMTYPLSTTLMGDYRSEFNRITRTTFEREGILSTDQLKVTRQGRFVDPAAAEMFSFNMLSGSRSGLEHSGSMFISRSLAQTLFGNEDPINRTLRFDNRDDVTVTGVFDDFPENCEFYNHHYFAPWSLYMANNKWIEERAANDWRNHFLKIYVEIPEGKTFADVTDQIKGALQFAPEDMERATASGTHLHLYPMREWHLYPPWLETGAIAPVLMLKWVGAIGLFVLLLACINFVNLSTARAEKRSREVGIRKTVGSVRSQLINQFFSESFLVVVLAFVIAIALTVTLLPMFNSIAGRSIVMPWSNAWFWLACSGFILITSMLAGTYPALYLSSFNPVKALKGALRWGRWARVPRQVLVVFQFCISVTLIIGTVVVYQQIQFAKDRSVGYDRDGLIMIRKRTADFNGKYDVLRSELKRTGAVIEVSESMGPMTEIYSGNNGWDWTGNGPDWDENFGTLAVSHLHGKTVGWQFVQGRDFDPDIAGDSLGIVINEAALKVMNLNDPIGHPVSWTWWSDPNRQMHYQILGVVKDMVMESPYTPAQPTIFYVKGLNGTPSWVNIRINPKVATGEALAKIESVFKKIIPSVPFDYKFADEEYALKFSREELIGNLAGIFAVLAVIISCLGLLGLASFVAERRTKEIGIRKVLGASVIELWRMLSREFVLLVMVSSIISAPLAFYVFDNWLSNFAYRTTISVWLFFYTGLAAVAITLLTVSYQSIRAALMNPVRSLKTE